MCLWHCAVCVLLGSCEPYLLSRLETVRPSRSRDLGSSLHTVYRYSSTVDAAPRVACRGCRVTGSAARCSLHELVRGAGGDEPHGAHGCGRCVTPARSNAATRMSHGASRLGLRLPVGGSYRILSEAGSASEAEDTVGPLDLASTCAHTRARRELLLVARPHYHATCMLALHSSTAALALTRRAPSASLVTCT